VKWELGLEKSFGASPAPRSMAVRSDASSKTFLFGRYSEKARSRGRPKEKLVPHVGVSAGKVKRFHPMRAIHLDCNFCASTFPVGRYSL
jgi:hypothetical protein